MTSLDTAGVPRQIEKQIQADIDSWSIWRYAEEHRRHLGASKIGENCMNQLWLDFRWCTKEQLDGRKYRLFQRGHREEPLMFEMLRGIGFTIWDRDENGEQFRMSGIDGHYGGSVDAIAKFPIRYNIDESALVSIKTSGTGSAFNKYDKDGIKIANQLYYDQENAYGFKFNIQWAIWFVVNKNDDFLYIEIEKLDLKRGEQLERKAEIIIRSQQELGKISKSPTFHGCKFCKHTEVCHEGKLPEKNCRSCKHARPVENKQWFCEPNNSVIPDEVIAQGCNLWVPIVNAPKE